MSLWKHREGDTYLPIQVQAWMNETGHGEHYYRIGDPTTHDAAIGRGFLAVGSDDFNLGVIRDRRLVALLWMNEVTDNGPDVLRLVASEVGLVSTDTVVTP